MENLNKPLVLTLTNATVSQRQAVTILADATYHDLESSVLGALGLQEKDGVLIVGDLFRQKTPSVLLYRPRQGALLAHKNLAENKVRDQDEIYFWISDLSLLPDNILLAEKSTLGQVAILFILEHAGSLYPIIVPRRLSQDGRKGGELLSTMISRQVEAISGDSSSLPDLAAPDTMLLNTRSGLSFGLVDAPTDLSSLLQTGDVLQLGPMGNSPTAFTSESLLDAIEIEDIEISLEAVEDEIEVEDPVAAQISLGEEQEAAAMPEQSRRKAVTVGSAALEIVYDDITRQDTDAIVNAANSSLAGGGGVDGAIHRVAGRQLVRASRALAPCPPGEAVLTPGFRLPARWVIHTVGPMYQGGNEGEAEVLVRAYTNSLILARTSDFKSISFPSISTGIYGYPIDQAAHLALRTCHDWLVENGEPNLIRFVLYTEHGFDTYSKALDSLLSNARSNVAPTTDASITEADS